MQDEAREIRVVRGDSDSVTVVRSGGEGQPVPFEAGDTVYFTVKDSIYTAQKRLQKIARVFGEAGEAVFALRPDDTRGLGFRTYVYDVQLSAADGTVTTLVPPSPFVVGGEVTYD